MRYFLDAEFSRLSYNICMYLNSTAYLIKSVASFHIKVNNDVRIELYRC